MATRQKRRNLTKRRRTEALLNKRLNTAIWLTQLRQPEPPRGLRLLRQRIWHALRQKLFALALLVTGLVIMISGYMIGSPQNW